MKNLTKNDKELKNKVNIKCTVPAYILSETFSIKTCMNQLYQMTLV